MKHKITALCLVLILVFTLTGYGQASDESSMYAQAENWAYLETDKTATADVFFICPTVFSGEADCYNMSMDDEAGQGGFPGGHQHGKGNL